MQFFASSAMSISPDTLVLIICMMAFLIGPCLFICLYSTAYVIDVIVQYFFPEDQPPVELGPDTRVGCPDGLCYLHMFMSRYHDLITRRLGHFPSILALSTVSKSYRRNHARGKLELIGDGLAHYEPNLSGDLVWEIVEKLTIPLDLIGGRNLVKISSKPPKGYGYIELFNPLNRNDILQILGSNPHLQDLISINSDYRLDLKGFLWNVGDNNYRIIVSEVQESLWEEIGSKVEGNLEARITN